ncbi:MAG TPA: toll/interleukin-1 receptor domain-containing protein [Candidatus Binatus sp.]|nr:toll/interleukin-1 receptor domain-containing protein [Candidatus Binatus sp.]
MDSPSTAQYDAFLSYCRDDETRVLAVQQALEQRGIAVWRDVGQIKAGDPWIKNIENGLRQSRCMVLFNSQPALQSEWVQREWNVALTLNMRIIPVRLDAADVPLLLKPLEFIDLCDPTRLDEAIAAIVTGIRAEAAPVIAPKPVATANPSALGRDVTILDRMIHNQEGALGNLATARWAAGGLGLAVALGAVIWGNQAPLIWTATMALGALIIGGAITWAITAQLNSNRSAVTRLSTIKDAIELYCPQQQPCVEFRTELEKILRERAGIKESH